MDRSSIHQLLGVLLVVLIPSAVRGAGLACDENFIVLAPDQPLAEEVLARANAFRKQVAEQWFGEDLPPGAGKATIHVRLSDAENSGFTWAIDGAHRNLHKVWLETTRHAATGPILHHEVVHVVFATRFPDRLPLWIEEGIAARVDGLQRIDARRQILHEHVRTRRGLDFHDLFDSHAIAACDLAAYSVAASVTEYLLTRGDKAALLDFAVSGKREGWDQALRKHYDLNGLRDLQAAWQAWASRPANLLARRPPGDPNRLPREIGQP